MENQIVCVHCNSANSTKNLFCQNCGKPLTAARPAAPVVPVQPANPLPEPQTVPPHPPSFTGSVVSTPPSFQPVSQTPPPTPPQYPSVPPVFPQSQVQQSETPPPTQPSKYPQSQQPQFPPTQNNTYQQQKSGMPGNLAETPMPLPQFSIGAKVEHLGIVVDSWADVIENGAEKGAAIAEKFDQEMEERRVPDIQVMRKEMGAEGAPAGRTFHLLQSSQGGTMAVYFGAQGKDLLISWDLYVKPKLNLTYLAILLGGTALFTLVITLITGVLGVSFLSFLFAWVNRFYNWLLPVIIGAALVGLFLRGDLLAFIFKRFNKFAEDDLAGLVLIGHQVIYKAVEAAGLDASKLRVKKGFRGTNWFRKI